MNEIIGKALIETLEMVFVSTTFSVILGFIPAIILTVTANDGLKPNKIIYTILDFIVNTLRSFPFIILMVVIIPLTRLIAGKSIGTEAAMVPLTIAAAPFVARVIESSLREVDKGIIEAAKSFGASNTQIIFKVMLKEAVPSIMSGITLNNNKYCWIFCNGRSYWRWRTWSSCNKLWIPKIPNRCNDSNVYYFNYSSTRTTIFRKLFL